MLDSWRSRLYKVRDVVSLPLGSSVPYRYYARLTPQRKALYRRSDGISTIVIPRPEALHPLAESVRVALERGKRQEVEHCSNAVTAEVVGQLGTALVVVRVLSDRPTYAWGELHGLYEPTANRQSARISVWMHTAKRRQVVAFRTFLRTLLHELCHHLDYALLKLPDSLHTEGFYKRESSLMRAAIGTGEHSPGPRLRA